MNLKWMLDSHRAPFPRSHVLTMSGEAGVNRFLHYHFHKADNALFSRWPFGRALSGIPAQSRLPASRYGECPPWIVASFCKLGPVPRS